VVLCPACDLAHRGSPQSVAERMQCVRCRALLQRPANAAIDTALALALSALVLLLVSNAYPLVIMHVNGSSRDTTLIGAALGLYAQGYASLALLVVTTLVVIPLLEISALLYVLIPLRGGRRALAQETVLRVITRVRPWSFMEVFMLGALVASVRLSNFAEVTTGISLWSCLLLMLCLSGLTNITSPEQLWSWVERSRR
jgi:paraquat-inducible protein A